MSNCFDNYNHKKTERNDYLTDKKFKLFTSNQNLSSSYGNYNMYLLHKKRCDLTTCFPYLKLAINGVTVQLVNAELANVGDVLTLNNIAYTIVDEALLRQMVNNNEDVTRVVTTLVTDMSLLFLNKSTFNQDISSWDTSNVTNMNRMFELATAFNQDLSVWCVQNIDSLPNNFAYFTALIPANYPVWGTCP